MAHLLVQIGDVSRVNTFAHPANLLIEGRHKETFLAQIVIHQGCSFHQFGQAVHIATRQAIVKFLSGRELS